MMIHLSKWPERRWHYASCWYFWKLSCPWFSVLIDRPWWTNGWSVFSWWLRHIGA